MKASAFILMLLLDLMPGACAAATPRPETTFGREAYVWRNPHTGATISIRGRTATLGARSWPLIDCSTARLLCVESAGPINLIVNLHCADNQPNQVGDHQTLVWSTLHGTAWFRDSRSPQLLFEYSEREGLSAIYYAEEGLALKVSSGPDWSTADTFRFAKVRGPRFFACRRAPSARALR